MSFETSFIGQCDWCSESVWVFMMKYDCRYDGGAIWNEIEQYFDKNGAYANTSMIMMSSLNT